MPMTNLRAEEVFCDFVVRRGGDPWGFSVLREWSLDGLGSKTPETIAELEFALPILSSKASPLPLAAIDLLSTNRASTACLVSNARELRDFLAAGYPVAFGGCLLVGYEAGRFLSTDGWTSGEEFFESKMIAFSENPSWTAKA